MTVQREFVYIGMSIFGTTLVAEAGLQRVVGLFMPMGTYYLFYYVLLRGWATLFHDAAEM